MEDDVPILNPTYKALISAVVIPAVETVVNSHNPRPTWIIENIRDVAAKSEV